MTEVWQGPTPCVHFTGGHFNEVSVKRELTVLCAGQCNYRKHTIKSQLLDYQELHI